MCTLSHPLQLRYLLDFWLRLREDLTFTCLTFVLMSHYHGEIEAINHQWVLVVLNARAR